MSSGKGKRGGRKGRDRRKRKSLDEILQEALENAPSRDFLQKPFRAIRLSNCDPLPPFNGGHPSGC